ncbi:MAG: hypothetical protein WCV82_02455 [Candidatus Paceibacterota bacterium]
MKKSKSRSRKGSKVSVAATPSGQPAAVVSKTVVPFVIPKVAVGNKSNTVAPYRPPSRPTIVVERAPGEGWLTMDEISSLGFQTRGEYEAALASAPADGPAIPRSCHPILTVTTSPIRRHNYLHAVGG